jgi:hypothetical protein
MAGRTTNAYVRTREFDSAMASVGQRLDDIKELIEDRLDSADRARVALADKVDSVRNLSVKVAAGAAAAGSLMGAIATHLFAK